MVNIDTWAFRFNMCPRYYMIFYLLKGNNPPSSFFRKHCQKFSQYSFLFSFQKHLLFPKLNHGFRKITESKEASLSEPYTFIPANHIQAAAS